MAYQPAANVIQLSILHVGTGALQGCEAQFSLYFECIAVPTQANVDAMASAANNAYGVGDYGPIVSSSWITERAIAQSLHVEGGPRSEVLIGTAGTRAGTPVPPNCPMLVRFRSPSGGAESRGRIYMPVGVEADLEGNDWTAAFATQVQGVVNTQIGLLEASVTGSQHAVISRYEGFELVQRKKATRRAGSALVTSGNITVQTRREVASQRNRRASV